MAIAINISTLNTVKEIPSIDFTDYNDAFLSLNATVTAVVRAYKVFTDTRHNLSDDNDKLADGLTAIQNKKTLLESLFGPANEILVDNAIGQVVYEYCMTLRAYFKVVSEHKAHVEEYAATSSYKIFKAFNGTEHDFKVHNGTALFEYDADGSNITFFERSTSGAYIESPTGMHCIGNNAMFTEYSAHIATADDVI